MDRQGDPLGDVQQIKSDHMNKWYMHNPAPVLENNTHKLLDFDIQTDRLISARKPDLKRINKKQKLQNCRLAVPADLRIKLKEVKRRISTSTLLGNWKTMEHQSDNYTYLIWCSWYSH